MPSSLIAHGNVPRRCEPCRLRSPIQCCEFHLARMLFAAEDPSGNLRDRQLKSCTVFVSFQTSRTR